MPFRSGLPIRTSRVDEISRSLSTWLMRRSISLFDVSDPSDPKEVDTFVLEDAYTDVEWDHHAFLYWAPEQIMVMPLQDWQNDFAGALAFKLDDGIREFGRITHDEDDAGPAANDCRQIW